MFRNLLCLLVCLSMQACIIYYDDDDPYYHSQSPALIELWLEDASIQCDYNWDGGRSWWNIIIFADSYYGPAEIEYVYFTIESYESHYMHYQGAGMWEYVFTSSYYHCHEYLEFEFVARDYDGNQVYYLLGW